MAQRILFKDSGLGNSNNPLSGYKFVGYNGLTFSQLDSDGNLIPIAGTGSSGNNFTSLTTGNITITEGSSDGYVLTSDSSGVAYWTASVGGSGTSGTSGVNGVAGTSGTSGVNGAAGTSGTSGVNGADGGGSVSGTTGYYAKFGLGGTISTSSSIFQIGNRFDVIGCDNIYVYPGPSSSYSKPYFEVSKEYSEGASLTVRGNISSPYLSSYVKLAPDNRTSSISYNIVSRTGTSNISNIGLFNRIVTRTNPFDSEYGGFGTGERIGVRTEIDTISNSDSYGQIITITGTGSVKYGDYITINGANSGNSYGLYVNVTQASNNYGVYVANGISYFGNSVGVGTPTPDSKAILDLSSTTKGFLPPRMTADQANAAFGTQSTAPEGMLVYITATSSDPAVDACFFDVGWYGRQDAPGPGYPGSSAGFNWVKFGYYSYG